MKKEVTDDIAHDTASRNWYAQQQRADIAKYLAPDALRALTTEIDDIYKQLNALTVQQAEQRRLNGVITTLAAAIKRSKDTIAAIPISPQWMLALSLMRSHRLRVNVTTTSVRQVI